MAQNDELETVSKEFLAERMDQLARDYAALKRDDPRRAEILEKLSQLSLIGGSMNYQWRFKNL